MWLRSSVLVLLLCSCGFQPMEAKRAQVPLPQIDVKVDTPQELRVLAANFTNHLEDLLSQTERRNEVYVLNVSINTSVSGGLIAPDGKAQRYTMTMYSYYTVARASDGVAIDSGSVSRSGSYLNRPNVYFSTFVSEQDTTRRLSKELAEEYHLLLASRLGSPEKLGGIKTETEQAPLPYATPSLLEPTHIETPQAPQHRGIFNSLF